MKIFKLQPAYKDYIWGGSKLKEKYGKSSAPERTAESWELSCHPDGECFISNGKYAGQTLSSVVMSDKEMLGANCDNLDFFPIMLKLIDAREDLSIQVHPDNDFALAHEGQLGKTEMWYIIEHEEGACLYYGLKKEMSQEEFAASIQDSSVMDALNKVYVKNGDVFFIEPGTVHAIGKGILLAEIQQNSNVTYRLYDYGRLTNGKPRELHIKKGTSCSVLKPPHIHKPMEGFLATCEYFSVMKCIIQGSYSGCVADDTFHSLLILDGNGTVTCGEEHIDFIKGDSLFIPANTGNYIVNGNCEMLISFAGIPKTV